VRKAPWSREGQIIAGPRTNRGAPVGGRGSKPGDAPSTPGQGLRRPAKVHSAARASVLSSGGTMGSRGAVAEWLGRGLQSPVQRFKSAPRLLNKPGLMGTRPAADRGAEDFVSSWAGDDGKSASRPACRGVSGCRPPRFFLSRRGAQRSRRRAPDVGLPVPVRDSSRADLSRVVVADEVELAVRRPNVLAGCAVAAPVLEAEVPLTSLHTSLTLGGSCRRAKSPSGGSDRYRRPPRSRWARKKFSEPAVAIAAEAEISRASVAAATTCARR
jgi:hypothetical protein